MPSTIPLAPPLPSVVDMPPLKVTSKGLRTLPLCLQVKADNERPWGGRPEPAFRK